jgi:glyoxylase-like metal-dependent hydrolase (beta-lactamase superfamily II)
VRVRHLTCALMNPPSMPGLVAHVLACETDEGVVLVDTGFGLDDHRHPAKRLGPTRHLLRPVADDALTAVRQLEAWGHTPSDVTHIVLTHLDLDHAGGLSDFPDALVHTTADEHAAAVTDPDFLDRRRYRPAQLAHGPHLRTYAGPGDPWREGLTGHEVLPGITLVPMPGHSRGHAAVAVDAGERGLLLHAGDAVFDASSYAESTPAGRPLTPMRRLRAFEQVVGRDRAAIRRNHATLRVLDATDGVTVIPAHDHRVLEDLIADTLS